MTRRRTAGCLAALALSLAACGGTTGRPAADGSTAPTGPSSAAASRATPAASPSPTRSAPTAAATRASAGAPPSRSATGTARPTRPAPVRVVAVGDIACAPGVAVTATTCQQQATAQLTASLSPQLVLALGDLQYEDGSAAEFVGSTGRGAGWRP
ncbi:MAG: hypothetical protein R2731_02990 [Nocardioides sp.]